MFSKGYIITIGNNKSTAIFMVFAISLVFLPGSGHEIAGGLDISFHFILYHSMYFVEFPYQPVFAILAFISSIPAF